MHTLIMAVRNGMQDTVLMCFRVRVFNIIYKLTPNFDTIHMGNCIRFATNHRIITTASAFEHI